MENRKTSILAVDDNVNILSLLRDSLEPDGYNVKTARNGEDALNEIDHEMPDLILLDINMPGLDGYAVCQRIREFSQVPIVMLTSCGLDDEKVRGFECGADDYVIKPFGIRELEARIKAVIRRSHPREVES